MSEYQTIHTMIERARDRWMGRFIDLGRRNNLLYYRELKAGTLDCTTWSPHTLDNFLGGQTVLLQDLCGIDIHPNLSKEELAQSEEAKDILRRLTAIQRKTVINREEKGLETLFLTFGMATWPIDNDGRPPCAPVLLVPITFQLKNPIRVSRTGEAQINPVLLHVLAQQHNCSIEPEQLLEGAESVAEDEVPNLQGIYEQLRHETSEIRGFAIGERITLSNFSYQKMAMVQDLQDYLEEMKAHEVIAAIAGASLLSGQNQYRLSQETQENPLDEKYPDQEFLVFDADSSQQTVIQQVLAGQNCVIEGPPGTGKSQTIANLITELAANGKSILFVAEKKAALDVVMQRLYQKGLGHLVLDLYRSDMSRRQIMQQFADSFSIIQNTDSINANEIHRQFINRRNILKNHAQLLHQPQEPSGKSFYEIQSKLLDFSDAEKTTVRFRGKRLQDLAGDRIDQARCNIIELQSQEITPLFLNPTSSIWADANLPSSKAVLDLLDLIRELSEELHNILDDIDRGLPEKVELPDSIDSYKTTLLFLREVHRILNIYRPEIFEQNLTTFLKDMAPAQNGFISTGIAWIFNHKFNDAVKTVKSIRYVKDISEYDLLQEVREVQNLLFQWQQQFEIRSCPRQVSGLSDYEKQLKSFSEKLKHLASQIKRDDLITMTFEELERLFENLLSEESSARNLGRIHDIETMFSDWGLKSFLDDLRRSTADSETWLQRFDYAWLSSCFDVLQRDYPNLAQFNREAHEQFVQEFCDLDRQRIDLSVQRVCRAHAEKTIDIMNAYPEETDLVRRESRRARKHSPLRVLLANAPHVLPTLRPCWMASPLSVSQLLDADSRYFDVVIFDEASQVLPEDGVPAILRSHQVVVAGDSKQLPPTTFFTVTADDSDEDDEPDDDRATEGYESLLDTMSAVSIPSYSLKWHYRSRHEELIAFSNNKIYSVGEESFSKTSDTNQKLFTFPSPNSSQSISHILVPHVIGQDGLEECTANEVRTVIQLIQHHIQERPERSLGVITMGVKHANRIQSAVDELVEQRPDLAGFFDESRPDRFFVKNIERVQGDERDAIILSIGYGKEKSGNLPYRFGPLLGKGGERRLNVAITRSREKMTVVSSFDHRDMQPGRSKAKGIKLLREYLEYASHPDSVSNDSTTDRPASLLEDDIFTTLSQHDIALERWWGKSNYPVDLVVKHPTQADRFILAIECDGRNYAQLQTVRDRDRLRQQQLEALGWQFHRIWSIAWVNNRDEEIQRVLDAYETAVRYADEQDARFENANTAERLSFTTDLESVTPTDVTSITETIDSPRQRSDRPNIPQQPTIAQYSHQELEAMVRWIQSDGRLYTDEDIIQELVPELGFRRRGSRIERELRSAMQRVREQDNR